jgi:hypothetical protein
LLTKSFDYQTDKLKGKKIRNLFYKTALFGEGWKKNLSVKIDKAFGGSGKKS